MVKIIQKIEEGETAKCKTVKQEVNNTKMKTNNNDVKKKRQKSMNVNELRKFLHLKENEKSNFISDENELLNSLYDEIRHGSKMKNSHKKMILQNFNFTKEQKTMLVGKFWDTDLRNEVIKIYQRHKKNMNKGTLAQAILEYSKPKWLSKEEKINHKKNTNISEERKPDLQNTNFKQNPSLNIRGKKSLSLSLPCLQKKTPQKKMKSKFLSKKSENVFLFEEKTKKNVGERKKFKSFSSKSHFKLDSLGRDRITEYFKKVTPHETPKIYPVTKGNIAKFRYKNDHLKLLDILQQCKRYRSNKEKKMKSTFTIMDQYFSNQSSLIKSTNKANEKFKKEASYFQNQGQPYFKSISVEDYFKHENSKMIKKNSKRNFERYGRLIFKEQENMKNQLERCRRRDIRKQLAPVLKNALKFKRKNLC